MTIRGDSRSIRAETSSRRSGRVGHGTDVDLSTPDDADDVALRESWGRYERHSVSPGTAASMVDMINATDIREILPGYPGPDARHRSDGVARPVRARPAIWPNTSPAQRTSSCRAEAACCGRATRMHCCARSSTSSTGSRPAPQHDPRPRHRALHRHRRLDRPRGRDRRRQMARAPGRARPARPSIARPVRRTRGEDDG